MINSKILYNFNFLLLCIIIRQDIIDIKREELQSFSRDWSSSISTSPPLFLQRFDLQKMLITWSHGAERYRAAPRRVASRRKSRHHQRHHHQREQYPGPVEDRRANICEREDRVRRIRQGYVSKHIQLAPLGTIAGVISPLPNQACVTH